LKDHPLEDAVQLVLLRGPRKQSPAIEHLEDNAGSTPDVHGAVIGLGKQDFGGPIPEGYHHRGELHFRSVGLGQAEVSDLEVALRGDQQVLGLQVPMDDAMRVQKVHTSKQFP